MIQIVMIGRDRSADETPGGNNKTLREVMVTSATKTEGDSIVIQSKLFGNNIIQVTNV